MHGSGHAEYTKESELTGDESKCYETRKVCADRNELCVEKEWRP